MKKSIISTIVILTLCQTMFGQTINLKNYFTYRFGNNGNDYLETVNESIFDGITNQAGLICQTGSEAYLYIESTQPVFVESIIIYHNNQDDGHILNWNNGGIPNVVSGQEYPVNKIVSQFTDWVYDINGVEIYEVVILGYVLHDWIANSNEVVFTTKNVGIGTDNPTAKLTVNGAIKSESFKVEFISSNNINTEDLIFKFDNAADFVFEDNYNLRSLNKVEEFINKNKHLPEFPSAIEFKENGADLANMNNLLLLKIEELTLYLIEQNKRIKSLKSDINALKQP